MAKVRKSDGDGTLAGTQSDDEDVPIPALPAPAPEREARHEAVPLRCLTHSGLRPAV
jgi:hypothetical protein